MTGYSAGSYSRSASWTIAMSPVMCSIAVRMAAPLPRLTGCVTTRIRGSAPASSRRMSAERSVLASLTQTSSISRR